MISKTEAIKLITEKIKKVYKKQTTYVYVSKELLEISNIEDFHGTKIFKNYNDKTGWLVFVDPLEKSSSYYKCEYYFVVSENEIILNSYCNWFPKNECEEIEKDLKYEI